MTGVWLKGTDGKWISADAIESLFPVSLGGGVWVIGASRAASIGADTLDGTFASSAEASEAARKLCQGVTVAELID